MRNKQGAVFPTGQLSDGKPRSILFDATKCIGCRQCVQACKDWNGHPRTTPYELSSTTWITIEPPVLEGQSSVWGRNSCMHCEFPMCAAVCPVEAIVKYAEGAVVIEQDRCVGCEYCIYACPWRVISKDDLTGKSTKCTMCNNRIRENENPFCVQACPVAALDFGIEEQISEKARTRAQEVGGYLYGDKEAGGTQLIYVVREQLARHGLHAVAAGKFPKHEIPVALMMKDLFTPRLGVSAKVRALYLAVIHPGRLKYRYWPWRRVDEHVSDEKI